MHRLFVAIQPPPAIRDLIVDAMDDSPELRWVSEDNIHLTLRFIGEVERPLAEDVVTALAATRSPRFSLKLAGVGQFARRSGGALWAAIAPSEGVLALAAKVERACLSAGLEPERRTFHPHITLARWNGRAPPVVERLLTSNAGLSSDPFEVSDFTLFESRLSRHGVQYETVADFPLARLPD